MKRSYIVPNCEIIENLDIIRTSVGGDNYEEDTFVPLTDPFNGNSVE